MARQFNGSSNYIACPSFLNITAGGGVSVSAWIFLTGNGCILCDSGSNGFNFKAGTTGLGLDQHNIINIGNSSGTITASTWTHIGFTYTNTGTAYVFYINGAASGSGSGGSGLGTSSTYDIGRNPSGGELFGGRIAELAVWLGTPLLTAADMASLGRGFSPRLVRCNTLMEHYPMIRDLVGSRGPAPTNNGSTVGDHCRVINARKSGR